VFKYWFFVDLSETGPEMGAADGAKDFLKNVASLPNPEFPTLLIRG
jgi:hypothetical protein